MAFILTEETILRAAVFLLLLSCMFLWERRLPRRHPSHPLRIRWTANLGISVINILVLRLGFPMLGFGLAVASESQGSGLFNSIQLPGWLVFILSLLLLDLLIWSQHWLFHRIPIFWRIHRMHHADQDFDTSTGVRFHPLEAVLSLLIKSAAIVILGVPPLAYLTFEIVLSSTSLFNHGNVQLPGQLDRWLRLVLVTPDMHRVHHSIELHETNSNFGFNLPWWDHLFGTYRAQPRMGHTDMTIGLEEFRTDADLELRHLLVQPFR